MGTVDAIAAALSGLEGIAKPIIEDAEAQKYDTQLRDTTSKIQQLTQVNSADFSSDKLGEFVAGLLVSAGYPNTNLSPDVSVPLDSFVSLLTVAANKIRDDQYLAKFTEKLTS